MLLYNMKPHPMHDVAQVSSALFTQYTHKPTTYNKREVGLIEKGKRPRAQKHANLLGISLARLGSLVSFLHLPPSGAPDPTQRA